MIKKILFLLLLVTIILVIIYSKMIAYGLGQARGQLQIIRDARPIEEVLQDSAVADSLKHKIAIIKEVRKYAIDSIGLSNSDNYTTFYDQKGKTLLWNLSGCEAYSFTPKTWSFPLLGSFPYKGFFDLEKAKVEREELKNQNYDTRIRPVGGWSTLGWFSDPILSNMLERDEGRLADLIIHELTHSTLFVKNNIQFNENLASFIGQKGALKFLTSKYGKNSAEVEHYRNEHSDGVRFTRQMLHSAEFLDSLYSTFDETITDSAKAVQKHILIDEITSAIDTIAFHNNRYLRVFRNGRPNNAYFMSFLRYHSDEDSLNAIYQLKYNNDLNEFIQGMKRHHED